MDRGIGSSPFRLSLPRNAKRMTLLALHAGLTTDEQLRVFEPAEKGTRKVIVATNIAEVSQCTRRYSAHSSVSQASVTIDGIKFVVDSGFVKVICPYQILLEYRSHSSGTPRSVPTTPRLRCLR